MTEKELRAQHLTEYQQQIEEHRRAITALTGAIQALERLEKETTDTTEETTHGNSAHSDTD